ncbi:hypothetical protein MKX01_001767 [Papaver californicum]|nr:hypothetical protein MKX01_001767 [Papaver californicum]
MKKGLNKHIKRVMVVMSLMFTIVFIALLPIRDDYAGDDLINLRQRFEPYTYGYFTRVRDPEGATDATLLEDGEGVVRLFESQPEQHSNSAALVDYVKALLKVDLQVYLKANIYAMLVLVLVLVLVCVSTFFGDSVSKEQLFGALINIILEILFLGAIMGKAGILKEIEPSTKSTTKFSDVKGVDEAKAELEEIDHYLCDPKEVSSLRWFCFRGPPGTGKTMLARAIAGEAGVPFFTKSGSEFEEMLVGVGARRLRDLFAAAKKRSPCIIFIDEIDTFVGGRNPKDQTRTQTTLNQFLVELDGFKQNDGIIVIAATNFPESLAKELIRPGRFDRIAVVPNPDVEGHGDRLWNLTCQSVSRKQMLARLDVCMGGRVAEELIFGDIVGLATHSYDDDVKSMSTKTRLLIKKEVKGFLDRAYNNTKTILTTHSIELHALANALLLKETLTGAQINALLAQVYKKQITFSSVDGVQPALNDSKNKSGNPKQRIGIRAPKQSSH